MELEIRLGWVGQFFVRFVIRLVSKLELFIFRPPSFFSLTTRFLAEVIGLRPALGESHQSFAAFYRGQLSRLNPGPNRAFRIPQITHFSPLSQPCFGAIMGGLGPSFFASPPRLLSCIPHPLPGEMNISQLQGKIEFNTFFF